MIQYIDKLMQDWARWSKVRRDGGLGYPSSAAGCRLMVCHGGVGDIVGIDEQSMEIEQIVVKLRKEKQELYQVIDWYYLTGNSCQHIANKIGCSRKTLYIHLHQVHQFVMDAMHDNEIHRQDVASEIRQKKIA